MKYIATTLLIAFMFLGAGSIARAEDGGKPNFDPACVKAAVEKRENSSLAAWDKFTSAARSALEARKTSLLAAWDLTDAKDRKTALQNAWQAFKEARVAAKNTLKTERLAAWQTFKTERIACKAPATGDSPQSDLAL